jgi:hypothetical protein
MSRVARAEEALERFDLIVGWVGDPQKGTACAVSALSWVAGEPWSDHPQCAHPLLCDIVTSGNDAPDTTPEDREALVRAGVTGLLDTVDVPTEVVLAALSGARLLPVLAGRGPVAAQGYMATAVSALCVLKGVTAWRQGARGFTGPLFLDATFWQNPRVSIYDWRYANLSGMDMRGAQLGGAGMARARLSGANLSGAHLRFADFRQADLSSANLAGSDLSFADLRGATVDGADFTDADLTLAEWSDIDPPPGWKQVDGRLYPADTGVAD